VGVTFVPPGDRLNPYSLGMAATLTGNWRLKVNSVTLNADREVEAVLNSGGQPANSPPVTGEQYTLVNVSMTYVGGGSSNLHNYLVAHAIDAEGQGTSYRTYCIPPPLDLNLVGEVFSGQTETGNLSYVIASPDADILLLTAEGTTGQAPIPVWFALH
jgi:hypothetical protein